MTSQSLIYELRTYEAVPGKLDALLDRFRNHAAKLFEKHGMKNIGFWVPLDDEGQPKEQLIYVVAHASREAAAASWASFWDDPEWVEVRTNGERVTAGATSVFMNPTDFSPLS